jgi:hypothetical protein
MQAVQPVQVWSVKALVLQVLPWACVVLALTGMKDST